MLACEAPARCSRSHSTRVPRAVAARARSRRTNSTSRRYASGCR